MWKMLETTARSAHYWCLRATPMVHCSSQRAGPKTHRHLEAVTSFSCACRAMAISGLQQGWWAHSEQPCASFTGRTRRLLDGFIPLHDAHRRPMVFSGVDVCRAQGEAQKMGLDEGSLRFLYTFWLYTSLRCPDPPGAQCHAGSQRVAGVRQRSSSTRSVTKECIGFIGYLHNFAVRCGACSHSLKSSRVSLTRQSPRTAFSRIRIIFLCFFRPMGLHSSLRHPILI